VRRWIAAAASLVILAGCDSPNRTVDATRKQLSAFQATPDAEKQSAVEQSLAKLDAQVDQLENKGDHIQADLFRRQASSLRTAFQAAKMARAFNDAKNAIQGIGEAFKDAEKSFSETLKNSGTNTP
jgi:predicted  nucleic acid-binding Zn-ribbon protein